MVPIPSREQSAAIPRSGLQSRAGGTEAPLRRASREANLARLGLDRRAAHNAVFSPLAVAPEMHYRLTMPLTLAELAEEAMALPCECRAYLAERLLETLDFEEDFAVSDLWLKEIRKRCQELDAGAVQTLPAEPAIAELRQSLA